MCEGADSRTINIDELWIQKPSIDESDDKLMEIILYFPVLHRMAFGERQMVGKGMEREAR